MDASKQLVTLYIGHQYINTSVKTALHVKKSSLNKQENQCKVGKDHYVIVADNLMKYWDVEELYETSAENTVLQTKKIFDTGFQNM